MSEATELRGAGELIGVHIQSANRFVQVVELTNEDKRKIMISREVKILQAAKLEADREKVEKGGKKGPQKSADADQELVLDLQALVDSGLSDFGVLPEEIPFFFRMTREEWDHTTEAEQDALFEESKRVNSRFFGGPLAAVKQATARAQYELRAKATSG